MRLPNTFKVLIIFLYTLTIKYCHAENELTLTDIRNSHNKEDVERNKRDISDFDEMDVVKEKRQRQFVGKRLRDFVGKRIPDEDGMYEPDLSGDDLDQMDKRMRDFVGKRSFSDQDALEAEKRMRDFVGKRAFELPEDGDFFGDHSQYADDLNTEPGNDYDKRMRDFVGKRSYTDYNHVSYLVKRLRDFVGKRFTPEDIVKIRQRYFVRKPKYEREIIGKRSSDFDDDAPYAEEKRMRDFVGKRMRDFVGKRMRDFVG